MQCVSCGQAMYVFREAWWLCHACGVCAGRDVGRQAGLVTVSWAGFEDTSTLPAAAEHEEALLAGTAV